MADTTLAVPSVTSATTQGNIDVAQVTSTSSATVLRENVVVADSLNFIGQAKVTSARGLMVDAQFLDMMQQILIELRTITQVLTIGLNVSDDPDLIRSDPSLLQQIQQ
jgi:ABC-type taurine transport system substrate-binding protein